MRRNRARITRQVSLTMYTVIRPPVSASTFRAISSSFNRSSLPRKTMRSVSSLKASNNCFRRSSIARSSSSL